jgi:hypothetical protein
MEESFVGRETEQIDKNTPIPSAILTVFRWPKRFYDI